ncbi:hypothetical protein D9V37_10520 [Nocardioides mangrovicus]|uniref:Uncharacterized protein n=1 Tax=Nocardioides mangrovicus TaxID=2478913 RepID=A0A3L8P350_9ACTN|nr:hypothetical protein D9V37_10520 [Nocardioides mangrovicus]
MSAEEHVDDLSNWNGLVIHHGLIDAEFSVGLSVTTFVDGTVIAADDATVWVSDGHDGPAADARRLAHALLKAYELAEATSNNRHLSLVAN